MAKFSVGDRVFYDRGVLAETAGYDGYVEARVTLSVDGKYWIEWFETKNGKSRKRSAQVSKKRLLLASDDAKMAVK